MKILWIDDEIELLKHHLMFLENKGYSLDTYNNGVEGIEMFKNNSYSAVLLDENMNGYDERMDQFERQLLEEGLRTGNGQIKETAELLNMTSKTLYRKMKKHFLDKNTYK